MLSVRIDRQDLTGILPYMLQTVSLVFLCLSPEASKNAEGIDEGLADFRERTCSCTEI